MHLKLLEFFFTKTLFPHAKEFISMHLTGVKQKKTQASVKEVNSTTASMRIFG